MYAVHMWSITDHNVVKSRCHHHYIFQKVEKLSKGKDVTGSEVTVFVARAKHKSILTAWHWQNINYIDGIMQPTATGTKWPIAFPYRKLIADLTYIR